MAFWSSWIAPSCEDCGKKITEGKPIIVAGAHGICAECNAKREAFLRIPREEREARRQQEEQAARDQQNRLRGGAAAPAPPPPPTQTRDLGVTEARDLLEKTGAFPEAFDDLGSVLDAVQADVAPGHTIVPLAGYGSGDYLVGWSYPDHQGAPLIVEVSKHGDHRLLAPSPRLFLQFVGVRWAPGWSFADDDEDAEEERAALDALHAIVGSPPFPPDSDAHREALQGHPDFSTALTPYAPAPPSPASTSPYWAKGAFQAVWAQASAGDVPGGLAEARQRVAAGGGTPMERTGLAEWCGTVGAHDLAVELCRAEGDAWGVVRHGYALDPQQATQDALATVLAQAPAKPPREIIDLPLLREAFEAHHRPWQHLVPEPKRPLARLEFYMDAVEAWQGFPDTEAHLRLRAAEVAMEMLRWDEAARLLDLVELPEAEAMRTAVAEGAARPRAQGLDALKEKIAAASDSARGPLEAQLGFALYLQGQGAEAYEHLEQAAMYLPSKYPHFDLVMEVAEALDAGSGPDEAMAQRVRDVIEPQQVEIPSPSASAADLMASMKKETRPDLDRWRQLKKQLQVQIFSPSDRNRAWRRAARPLEGPLRALDEILEPTQEELQALDELLKRLERGR